MVGRLTDMRTASRALFSNPAFMDVTICADRILSVSSDRSVTTRQVAAATRLPDSVVRHVMLRLRAAQMLDPLTTSGRAQLYRRTSPTRWAALLTLIADATEYRRDLNSELA